MLLHVARVTARGTKNGLIYRVSGANYFLKKNKFLKCRYSGTAVQIGFSPCRRRVSGVPLPVPLFCSDGTLLKKKGRGLKGLKKSFLKKK